MALDGISATASTTARPVGEQSISSQSLTQAADQAAPRSEAADSFREMLGNIHDNATKFQLNPGMETSKADPVDAAKADILPSPMKAAPKSGGASAPGNAAEAGASGNATADAISQQSKALQEGNKTLRQSFDHALFVTLVSQVISGVSQTTSTLVRQQ